MKLNKSDVLMIKTETVYGVTPPGPAITEIKSTRLAMRPIIGKRTTVIGFRFPCPCCGEIIIGEIVRDDSSGS